MGGFLHKEELELRALCFCLDCAFYAVITKCDEITRKKYILQNIILRYGYLSAKYLYTSLMEIIVHLKS